MVASFDLPDPDDCHVLAAAVAGECDLLITYNLKHFPGDGDVDVLSPDDALLLLSGMYADQLASVVARQIRRLKRPAMTAEDFLARLSKRAPIGAAALGTAMGVESYQRIFEDIVLSQSPSSPHGAVLRLVDAVRGRDHNGIVRLVDADFAAELCKDELPTAEVLCEELRRRLGDVLMTGGWGLATARRPHAPDVELVKLVRADSEPLVRLEEQVVEGHLFFMQARAKSWMLIGLDGPDPALEAAGPPRT